MSMDMSRDESDRRCPHCGTEMPEWQDIAGALESLLTSDALSEGIRPMLIQAVRELRELKAAAQKGCNCCDSYEVPPGWVHDPSCPKAK